MFSTFEPFQLLGTTGVLELEEKSQKLDIHAIT